LRKTFENYLFGNNAMNTQQIINHALQLNASQRFAIVNELLNSLDKPDSQLEDIWQTEAEQRLQAYRAGKLRGIPMEQIFTDDE
jgi:putative addiction module component (TIGR02574 family)